MEDDPKSLCPGPKPQISIHYGPQTSKYNQYSSDATTPNLHMLLTGFCNREISSHLTKEQSVIKRSERDATTSEAARATNTQQIWRQEFLGSRSSTVERSSTRTAAAGTFFRFYQTIFENTSLWRLKRLVSLPTYRYYINKCIYLSIYLSI